MSDIDISRNRKGIKYSKSVMVRRILWGISLPLFRLSPRPMFTWRASVLRIFGAKIGSNVHIYGSATIYMPWNLEVGDWSSIGEHAYIYNLGRVIIGQSVTISQRAHLCAGTHDYRKTDMPLIKPQIDIGDQVWVCADAFIGPGVSIGEGAVIGARAVAVKHVTAWRVVAGNPAREISIRSLDSQ